MVDPLHARQHIAELRQTLDWLRPLPPAGPRYKVWLGDLIEVARAVFGPESVELPEPRAVLARHGRLDPSSDPLAYLALLDDFALMLDGWLARLPEPIPLISIAQARPDADRPGTTEQDDDAR